MFTTLTLTLLLAARADAAPTAAVHRYECVQTNPQQFSTFELRFRTNAREIPEAPVAVALDDAETDTLRVRSSRPAYEARYARGYWYDSFGLDAYALGADELATEYVLLLPSGRLGPHVDAQVNQVAANGKAQIELYFECELQTEGPRW